MITLMRLLWPLPVTLFGALCGGVARQFGARMALHDGVLEACGGPLGPVLRRVYPPRSIAAITLGHVVLAQDEDQLDLTRADGRAVGRADGRTGGWSKGWAERRLPQSMLITAAIPDTAYP